MDHVKMKILLICCAIVGLLEARVIVNVEEDCAGYSACPKVDQDKITIHLIPHSHDDVGWLSTVDQYFYNQVETVISSVIGGLLQNEDRRFIQVETAYFYKWWVEQNDLTKNLLRQLTNEGRLEFIGGAWSMNDEATTHYQSIIDHFTLGLNYLQNNVGQCAKPKVGWQIDPFGHSREQASIFTQFGFDSYYFARIDYRDKTKRKAAGNMDLLWTGSANLGSDSNILTSVFETHYNAPSGFCFDIRCGDTLIVAEEESQEYNLDKRVSEFVEYINKTYLFYPTTNMLVTLGGDMKWEAAERTFNNVDKMIAGFKKFKPTLGGKEIELIYSTPSCYAKAVNDFVTTKNITLNEKTDDFFPFADGVNREWTGYYTSRPTSKRFERIGNNVLQASKQLATLADSDRDQLFNLESAMGHMQHHDAITGTEKTHVEKDYHRFLALGIDKATKANSGSLTTLLGAKADLDLKICPLSNSSICEHSTDDFNVLIYNPLAKKVSHYIQIPVTGNSFDVTDPEGTVLESVVTEPVRDFDYVAKDTGDTLHTNVLIFKADLPALGYNVYNIKKGKLLNKQQAQVLDLKEDQKVGFDDKYVVVDSDTGLLKSITLNGATLDLSSDIQWYASSDSSGAYAFRPDSNDRDTHQMNEKATNTILTSSGNVVRELKQYWNKWTMQTIRIYKDEDFIEFDYAVGPIDISSHLGKEVVLKYTTSLKTDGQFYTDANGREIISRKRDFYPTFNYTDEEPQAGNYYPINTKIAIEDDTTRFAVITDRSHGGSSLQDGAVEVMVNRAMTKDDGHGVGEALNEQEYGQGLVSRGSHFVTLGLKKSTDRSIYAVERLIAQRKQLQPIVYYPGQTVDVKSKSFITKDLPDNIHLLTLDKWNDGTVLIRLEHILEWDEDSELSQETTVDLTDLFQDFTIDSLQETVLSGTMNLEDSERLVWPQIKSSFKSKIYQKSTRLERLQADLSITLAPMQIRTFIATVTRK